MTRAGLGFLVALIVATACGGNASTGAINSSSSKSTPSKTTPTPKAAAAQDVQVGTVQFFQDTHRGSNGQYGDAWVRLTNPNKDYWLPVSQYVFSAKDAGGTIFGTQQGSVSLGPGQVKDITTIQIDFGQAGAKVDHVEFQLRPKQWLPASSYPNVAADISSTSYQKSQFFSKVTGQVTNKGANTEAIGIHCVLWEGNPGDKFAGSAVTSVQDVAPGVTTPFSASVLHEASGASNATCYGAPQDVALNG